MKSQISAFQNTLPESGGTPGTEALLAQMQAALALMEEMFAALQAQLVLTRDLVEELEDRLDDDPDPSEAGRLVISADGNQHDPDDILSAPMSLALIAATGRQDELELMIYNDHIWSSDPEKKALMTESVLQGGERFGFDGTNFISAVDRPAAAVQQLAAQINKSTAEDPLTILMAGPGQIVGRAIFISDPAAREHVTVVSHSIANDTHAEHHGTPYTWEYIETTGVIADHIPNQNQKLNTAETAWDWMQEDPDLAWVADRNQKSTFDTSDSGMTYYYLTGDEAGTPAKFQDILT